MSKIKSLKASQMVVDGFTFEIDGRYRLAEPFTPSRASKPLKNESLIQILEIKSDKLAKVMGIYEGQIFDVPFSKIKKEDV